jgi:hypothetical protein
MTLVTQQLTTSVFELLKHGSINMYKTSSMYQKVARYFVSLHAN